MTDTPARAAGEPSTSGSAAATDPPLVEITGLRKFLRRGAGRWGRGP